MEEYNFVS